jgi:hypothetical protein
MSASRNFLPGATARDVAVSLLGRAIGSDDWPPPIAGQVSEALRRDDAAEVVTSLAGFAALIARFAAGAPPPAAGRADVKADMAQLLDTAATMRSRARPDAG